MDTTGLNGYYHELYIQYVATLLYTSAFALTCYTAILDFSREMECVLLKPIRLPSVFYLLTRYGGLMYMGLAFYLELPELVRTLNGPLAHILYSIIPLFLSIGVQGVLTITAYSLCQRRILSIGSLVVGFILSQTWPIYFIVLLNEPLLIYHLTLLDANLISICLRCITVLTDFLISGICLRNISHTWRSRREAKPHFSRESSLVYFVLTRCAIRSGFMIILNVMNFIAYMGISNFIINIILQLFSACYQDALSIILITDYILEVREHNASATIPISLRTTQLRNALQRSTVSQA